MRKLNDAHRAVTPFRTIGPQSWDDHDDTTGPRTRATSPYQVGDVVKFLDGGTIKDALIIQVGSKLQESRGRWVPTYMVRPRTKAGTWANLWRRIYPGDIERGFGTWEN